MSRSLQKNADRIGLRGLPAWNARQRLLIRTLEHFGARRTVDFLNRRKINVNRIILKNDERPQRDLERVQS